LIGIEDDCRAVTSRLNWLNDSFRASRCREYG
jgi:hypothetical protein